jgi:hypothetical protein
VAQTITKKGKPPARPGRRAKFDKSRSRVEPNRREPLKIHEEEALHDSVEQSSAPKMGVQVPSWVDMGRQGNFTGKHFWTRGYYVSTVGVDEDALRQYIQHQAAEDRRLDQLGMFDEMRL